MEYGRIFQYGMEYGFLEWNRNGMEENCRYGIWKNRLPFHSIPCPVAVAKPGFRKGGAFLEVR